MENSKKILNAMKELAKDKSSIVTENFNGSNIAAFSEFAEVNGFNPEDCADVYLEYLDTLEEIYNS